MRKAFSLIELILVLVIISILSVFILSKFDDSSEFANKTKVKLEIALIRNGISKQISSNVLLNKDENIYLDKQSVNLEGSLLFKNILDFPLISTSEDKKELGKWIKTSSNRYIIYISNDEYLEFTFENNSFVCKSDKELCVSYE
ncbi:type II secretion system protein [Halarcobacter sp.]|uniref:type II secretion system protein n=1 Tax=Halarcobacter sp. TaxID=2321133 RepID=UPI002AAB6204|nr:type II secretion system protein [Halarcobacter sp.]